MTQAAEIFGSLGFVVVQQALVPNTCFSLLFRDEASQIPKPLLASLSIAPRNLAQKLPENSLPDMAEAKPEPFKLRSRKPCRIPYDAEEDIVTILAPTKGRQAVAIRQPGKFARAALISVAPTDMFIFRSYNGQRHALDVASNSRGGVVNATGLHYVM